MLAIPSWVPFVRLVLALAGLSLGNAKLAWEARGGTRADSPEGRAVARPSVDGPVLSYNKPA